MNLSAGRVTSCRTRGWCGGRWTRLEPHARELGSDRELEGIRGVLTRGNGSDGQRRIWNGNRDIVDVAREIANATEAATVTA